MTSVPRCGKIKNSSSQLPSIGDRRPLWGNGHSAAVFQWLSPGESNPSGHVFIRAVDLRPGKLTFPVLGSGLTALKITQSTFQIGRRVRRAGYYCRRGSVKCVYRPNFDFSLKVINNQEIDDNYYYCVLYVLYYTDPEVDTGSGL